jgi:transposase
MIRQRLPDGYDGWRGDVDEANIPEIAKFAEILDRDRNAVIAAITLPWSNGQTEGHVNRLKTIKRQMYGRAGFEMLRIRLLIPPWTCTESGEDPLFYAYIKRYHLRCVYC